MIVTVWSELTVAVETVSVADDAPAAIVTDAGTDAALELEDSMTMAPPVGAGAARLTVA